MSISGSQLANRTLRLGPPPQHSTPNKEAWKAVLGQKRVAARLSTLEVPQPRLRYFTTSAGLQVVALTLMVVIPMLFPQKLIPMMHYEVVQLLAPPTEVPLPPEPPKPPKVQPKVQPKPKEIPVEPPKVAKMLVPPKPILPKVKPKDLPQEAAPKLAPVFSAAKFEGPKEPLRPRPPVQTNTLGTGSAAPATLTNKRPEEVQTGGFGDPNGLPGKGDPNKRANIAQKGSMDLPPGPGYGNGTGGANGARGTIASTGFGNGVAIPPSGGARRGTIQASGFADETKPVEAPKKAAPPAASLMQPVEILAKPKPTYTEEARNLKIEGEVLLAVVFPANGGPVQVLRVVRGLGHGLDESASRAAQQIRYKPAMRDGHPADFPATVHIVFQLAY